MSMNATSLGICFILVISAAGLGRAHAQSTPLPLNDPALERRVDELLNQMTLDEKVGQLVHYSAGQPTGPGTARTDYQEQIARGQVGSLENLVGAAKVNAFQRIAMEKSRLRVPLLFALDVIHGYRTVFPVPLAMASTWDPTLVEQASRAAAKEATSEGIRQTYSPMVDIARDARWGRIVEGAGEDPYLGCAMAAAYVRGYQGNLSDPQSMVACLKHYVGYGAAEGGRDYNTVEISERTLRQVYLPPFNAGVEAGAGTIMSGFNSLNGVPVSANYFTLTTILRQEWGFRGFVMSDWGSVGELIAHGIGTDGATITRKAIMAGVDIDHESSVYTKHLAGLVHSGEVPESVVDEAVRRVLRVKFALGLFEHPYTTESPAGAAPSLDPETVALARTVAERSFVLLKNDSINGQAPLPLRADKPTVALIGPMADSGRDMLGPWIAEGEAKDTVTLRTALAERITANGGKLLYAQGTEVLSQSTAGFPAAIEAAKQADIAIVALGESGEWMSGEAASRVHLDFPGNQQQLLEAIVATGKPVLLVIFSGRPLDLTWAANHVPAILQAWFPGVQAGPALTRVLFGDVNPSGKLTVSMPRSVGQEPLYYNALNTGRPANGIDLTRPPKNGGEKYHSRYIDERNDALFPFGYGLSYTHFTYSPLTLSAARLSAAALNDGRAAALHISTTVTNAGARTGDEIAELYIRLRGTSVSLPVRQLKGFRKLSLKPGESAQVNFTLSRNELAFWNIDMREVVEPAQATVWIGPSSVEGPGANFTITK
jgi:beta-glucosidase